MIGVTPSLYLYIAILFYGYIYVVLKKIIKKIFFLLFHFSIKGAV